MTDEEIEKMLEAADDIAISEEVDCSDVLNYIRNLKENLESAIQSFTKMETLYKVKGKELEVAETKLQANLEVVDAVYIIKLAEEYGVEVDE